VAPERVESVWVGAETAIFPPAAKGLERERKTLEVLFYGQLIPLHGVQTIVLAARLLRDLPIHFVLIGSGQEAPLVRRLLDEQPLANLEWHPWVEYERLSEAIERADVCLGIFGRSEKAARVIPNKVFQVIAAGRPLVTRDSPAMRELVAADTPGIHLVRAGDADSLLAGIAELARQVRQSSTAALFGSLRDRIAPAAIGRQLATLLAQVAGARQGG
jgi:glycosyltransferase involved in cell wall biosynthesis